MSRARINPRMLEAQRKLAGIAPEDAARIAGLSSDTLIKAEAGEHALTSPQARRLAERYGCSLAYLYLEPPTESGEEASRELFRRFRDVPADTVASPELRSAMSDAEEVRDMALELLMLLADEPAIPATVTQLGSDARDFARRLRGVLEISVSAQAGWRNETEALRAWRLGIERAGALVMQAAFVPRGESDPGPVRGFVHQERVDELV